MALVMTASDNAARVLQGAFDRHLSFQSYMRVGETSVSDVNFYFQSLHNLYVLPLTMLY